MFHALVDDRADMSIRKGVKDGFAFAAVFDELALFERTQLVGDGALGHVQKLRDVADAHLGFEEHIEDFDPGGIAKNFEKFGQIIKDFIFRHLLGDFADDIFMRVDVFAAFNVVLIKHIFTTIHMKYCSYIIIYNRPEKSTPFRAV